MFYNLTKEYEELESDPYLPTLRVIRRILIYIIISFGIPANTICILILFRSEIKSPINYCIQFLAAFDGLFMISIVFYSNKIAKKFFFILTGIALTGSMWTTVLISLERFVALCYPLKARTLWSYKRTLLCNIFIVFLAICLNLPRLLYIIGNPPKIRIRYLLYIYMRFKAKPDQEDILKKTSRQKLDAMRSYALLDMIVLFLIPQIAIASLNVCIYMAVRKAEKTRREISQSQWTEISIAKVVFCIIAVFFACGTPILIYQVTNFFGIFPLHVYAKVNFFTLPLLAFNSSANVLIYSVQREDFRNILLNMLCSVCRRSRVLKEVNMKRAGQTLQDEVKDFPSTDTTASSIRKTSKK